MSGWLPGVGLTGEPLAVNNHPLTQELDLSRPQKLGYDYFRSVTRS